MCLFRPIDKRDIVALKELLDSGEHDVTTVNRNLYTPLMCASECGFNRAVVMLLEYGSDIEHKDNKLETSLHKAVLKNCYSTIKILIENGSDVDAKNRYGNTPLFYAVRNESYGTKIVEILLENGASIDVLNNLGNTPLMDCLTTHCLQRCPPACIGLLIEKGANVNIRNCIEETALMLALRVDNSIRIFDLLTEKGVEVDMKDYDLIKTILYWASSNGYITPIRFLLSNGLTNMSFYKYLTGNTPLMIALKHENFETAKFLSEHTVGEEINEVNTEGDTALMIASCTKNNEMVELLLKNEFCKASIDKKNVKGDTALMIALSRHSTVAVIKTLCENGADVNVKNVNGFTPLMMASKYNNVDVVKLLCERGATKDISAKNVYNYTALMIAQQWDNRDVIEFLKEKTTRPFSSSSFETDSSRIKLISRSFVSYNKTSEDAFKKWSSIIYRYT